MHTAYNELERMQQMLKASEEVVALRSESNHVLQQELLQGAALKSHGTRSFPMSPNPCQIFFPAALSGSTLGCKSRSSSA